MICGGGECGGDPRGGCDDVLRDSRDTLALRRHPLDTVPVGTAWAKGAVMGHRQEQNGQVGGDFASPGEPGSPMPEDDTPAEEEDDE